MPAQGGSPVAAAAASEASQQPPPTKVGIPLEGCTVELVADGLKGRSEFIRRAPLLVSHPKWPLLEGEQAFFLWAGAGCGYLQDRLQVRAGCGAEGQSLAMHVRLEGPKLSRRHWMHAQLWCLDCCCSVAIAAHCFARSACLACRRPLRQAAMAARAGVVVPGWREVGGY